MSIKQSANKTCSLIDNLSGERARHIRQILFEISSKTVTGNKAHRYLGWAQGQMEMMGLATLDEFRKLNEDTDVDEMNTSEIKYTEEDLRQSIHIYNYI